MKKKTVVRDLVDRVKSRGSRSKPTKEEKKQTPTLASRLKVKMNFSTGRKRKGAEEDKVEEKTPPNKRRKVNQQKEAAPAKRTPKGKTAKEETPKKKGRGRPPKSQETPVKQTAASKMAAKLKKTTAEKKTPGRKRKATEKEDSEPSQSDKEEAVTEVMETKDSVPDDSNTSTLEIQQLDESPRKKRVSKRPGRFAEGLTDEEINAPPPPRPTPKPPKATGANPKASPAKKKAPPKPKRKSVGTKPVETPKRNKELEDEVNLIASLTAQIEKAEALVKEAMDEEQAAEHPMDTEPEPVSSPETLIRRPNPADNFAADNIWTPKPQSSRYSGRKITPKIRSSPEEEIPTPRKHAGRGRGKNSKLLKRQNSKTSEVGRKRNKIPPPIPPKPRRKSKSESKSSMPPTLEPPGHNTTTAHMPPAPTHKPHISDDLLVNSEITEQSYEEFLSAVESGVPDLDSASASVPPTAPKKTSPKSVVRTPKQRTISESEIKLGIPIRDEDIIHTPPPTSPLVPSDDHSYSLSSRKYPALSMPPRSQGENGEDIAVPRFVSSPTAEGPAASHTAVPVSAAAAASTVLSSTESTSQGESSEEEIIQQTIAAPVPQPLRKTQPSQQVILGGLVRRRKSSGEGAGKSILIKSPTSGPGQIVTTSEGQSVLAQVLARPHEYTASKKPRSKVKTSTGPKQVITQIVSKEGKVVYAGGDGAATTPQLVRMSSGGGQQVILTSQGGTPTAGGQFTLLKQGDGGKMIVRKVARPGQQQAGFTRLSNITGVNQRFVLASPQKKPGQSLLAKVVSAATASSDSGGAVVTRILPTTASTVSSVGASGDSSDEGAVVVCTSSESTPMAGASGSIKFLYAGSSPPRSLALSDNSQVATASTSQSGVVSEMICSATAPTDIMESPPTSSLADSATLLQDDLTKQEATNSPHDNEDQINRDAANGLENLTDKL